MHHRDAIVETLNFAFPTIITSGSILSICGFLIGSMTSEPVIAGIGESLGRGTVISIIMVMFALLIIRGYWIALHARDRFGSLLAVGVTTQIALQVFLNIAVVTNLIPNTGISLPFFSYGGTALAVQLAEVGIVLSVSRQMR
jgi:cell division protein FtsW (lipid II flippase)